MIGWRKKAFAPKAEPRYPGVSTAEDGSSAVVAMETAASDAAGAYPITPSTQMGEGWAAAFAAGKLNVNGRPLLFFEPEGEHAAAAVTAGMSMAGLRSTNFSSGQGIAYMHESLYAAVGKRLTYVLNVACRAMTKHALNVHAGHDDYHAVDDTGFFQLFAKNVQEVADLNLIAHRIAELTLTPGICAQDGFLTSHVIETLLLPERELVREYLGDPADMIESPTPAQRMVFGEKRRRIPEMFDYDYPAMLGVVQNQDSYAQGVAAQRPFYFDHIASLTDFAFQEFEELTGRHYTRATGYRLEDAEYVIVGQGSVVENAEAVCDHLRSSRGVALGVLNLTMFRPFPGDVVTRLLKGKRHVVVLERVDQPLAVDAPVLREIRAAVSQALENGRADGEMPFPKLPAYAPDDAPRFFSGCFGLGSRDLQPGDIIAAVENMMESGTQRRQFYLGVDFVRPDTRLPKLQIWQHELLGSYPDLQDLALPSAGNVNLLPEGSTSIRIHSIGGWGAITMGKNLALTASELLGLHVKANPKYGSEKKGQPTTFYATVAQEAIRLNCELTHVDVVLSPDPNSFRHSDPLSGLAEGGVFIIQSELEGEKWWTTLPVSLQRNIRQRHISVHLLDGFKIASEEASDADLRYRMQGAAFMGAFFHVTPLMKQSGLDEDRVLEGIRTQLEKKFGHLGERVVNDNLRVIQRGFDEVRTLDVESMPVAGEEVGTLPVIPDVLNRENVEPGIGHPGRFWEQVCHLYRTGDDGIADPFAAISAIPAVTSAIRDMTDMRFEVPELIADKCTGCSQCWVQCPDTAIPGRVNTVEELLESSMRAVADQQSFDRFRQIVKHLGKEARRIMQGTPFRTFAEVLTQSYDSVIQKLAPPPDRRATLDAEFASIYSVMADLPLAKTAPFFDLPESKEKGTGGLLSITVNPETCKGCMLCVDVCPDDALVVVKQDDDAIDKLRRNWAVWKHLPDTNDRYVKVSNLEEGIGVLSSLLLKKENYRSMEGGDGACMGCGEKTVIHLVVSGVNALMLPRVQAYVKRLDKLIEQLDAQGRELLAADADLDRVGGAQGDEVPIALDESKREAVGRISKIIADLKDLRWRYVEGPGGNGRASCGFANATGCTSVWGSTYPYNPYPFPWVNHLFQDAPSIAIGVFEGHMRKMADGFAMVRLAEAVLAGEYDPEEHERFSAKFGWQQFNDEEFAMCPPLFAVGGDGAMLDIGFQNLSRLLASGKPIRVMVLDTQVYSNTGGQACTSGYLGQISDMAAFGASQHGKQEVRKELALIAIAHRQVFVLQSSQATPSHLMAGVLKGLQSRHPSVFILHSPCPPEHGIGDDAAARASKYALESRAFPFLVFDPDEGDTMPECLSLDGNPSPEDDWPEYDLSYVDEKGEEQTISLPFTTADWAATEGRFKKHFRRVAADTSDDDLVPFHEYLLRSLEDREGIPFINTAESGGGLAKLQVSNEIVQLAEERLSFWSELKQMAGLEVSPIVRDRVATDLEGDFHQKAEALRAEYETKLADLKAGYPPMIARRMARGLMRAGNGGRTITELLSDIEAMPGLEALPISIPVADGHPATVAEPAVEPVSAVAVEPAAPVVEAEEDDGALSMDPYIETARCTSCDECTNLNRKLFAYDDAKQAYFKDVTAGPFKDIVLAAEKCPVEIIHPGTPLNPKERDLDKWIARAEPFN